MTKKLILGIFAIAIAFAAHGKRALTYQTCSTRILTEADIDTVSLEELALMRNEIFARHGYRFSNEYYENILGQTWPKAGSNDEIELSAIEQRNVEILRAREQILQKRRDAAFRDLRTLRTALKEGDHATIKRFITREALGVSDLSEEWFKEWYDGTVGDLLTCLDNINLDKLHWNRGQGLYKVTIDNGYDVREHSLHIKGDTIRLTTGMHSHSEIFGDFGDGFSDYMSEGEYACIWEFTITDRGIVFTSFQAIG